MKKITLLTVVSFFMISWATFGQSYPPNPDVIVASFAAGPLSSSTVANAPVVVSDPYNSRVSTGGIPSFDKVWATAGQIGAVYGIAYSATQNKTYASAYVKRHTQLGTGLGGNPAGQGSAGAIYALNPPSSGGGPSTFTVLVDLGSAAGSTARTTASNWICDPVYYEVGTTGIGDIDVSPDGNFLWAMNMKNKSLYKISLPSGAILGSYAIPGVTGGPVFDAPVTNNENLDLRPCGLKVTQDKVYVGVISSGESLYPVGGLSGPCNEPGGFPALRGYVFEFNIGSASFNATPVLDFPFAGMTWNDGTCTAYNSSDKWSYWLPPNFTNYSLWEGRLRKPIISDIEILDGDLLIGIRNIQKDKQSTIIGLFYPNCTSGSEDGGAGGFGGQTLRACKNGNSWTIENNGNCGGTAGYNNLYFYNHKISHSGDHAGSIALKTGSGEVLLPSSPGAASGSMEFYSEATKNTAAENTIYNLYAYPINTDNFLFGKANGLGDVDLMTELPLNCLSSVTANAGNCNPANNQYTVTGQVTLTNPPSSGTITVQIVSGGSQSFTLPQTSPFSYSITGQIADGASHTVNVTISGVSCASTVTYSAPVSCSGSCQPDSLKICAGSLAELVAADGYSNYKWYIVNAPGDTVEVATGQTFTTSILGNYIYKATDGSGCSIKLCCPVTVADSTCCVINNVNLVVGNCENKGTLSNANDDEYTFTLNPSGNGIGATYTVNGLPNSPQTGTYGSPTTFGPYLISAGVLNISVVDNVSNTCTKTASVTPPPSCSVCTVSAPVLAVNDNICPSRTGSINVVQACGAGSIIQYSSNNGLTWSSAKPLYSTTAKTILARCVNTADTTCKSSTASVTTDPKKCPGGGFECSLIATATIDPCQDNGTGDVATDDYFTIQVNASASYGGVSQRYEVVIGASLPTGLGGNVLNSGGTLYGSPVTVGQNKQFKADGSSVYALIVRDIDTKSCFQQVNITPVAPCSALPPKSPCYPVPCVPIGLQKN